MKVLITPRSFGKYDDEPYRIMKARGVTVVENDTGSVLSESQMIARIEDVDGIIAGVDPLNENVLEHAKNLKAIAKYGVGTDNIDLDYCKKHGIAVSITKNANRNAVADYTFALMLNVARRVTEINNGCKNGDWSKKVSLDVFGKKLGVIGLGAIGRGVIHRAEGFDMQIYGYDVFHDDVFLEDNQVNFTDVETIFKECDFITLHVPLIPSTENLVNAEMLSKAKKNLVIVNAARGGIINDTDLYNALVNKQIFGAGLDVFQTHDPQHSKLLELPNCIVGSHTAASSQGAVNSMSLRAVSNLMRDLNSKVEQEDNVAV